jgi:lyso-ornithine lipid O-acyltransferase
MPAVFVAKREVASWPVFGRLARRSGTVFVDRTRPRDCARVVLEMRRALASGRRVVLFPEGTSSGGAQVLPFRSPLLEAALGFPVAAAAVAYSLQPGDGDPAEEVCYWRDMSFGPHLLRLLSLRRIHARLAFGPPAVRPAADRKALARLLQGEVASLHAQLRSQTSGKWEPRISSPSFTLTKGFMQ